MSIEFDYGDDASPASEQNIVSGSGTDGGATENPVSSPERENTQHASTDTSNAIADSTTQSNAAGGMDEQGNTSNARSDISGSILGHGIDLATLILDALLIVGLYILVKTGEKRVFVIGLISVFIYELINQLTSKRKSK